MDSHVLPNESPIAKPISMPITLSADGKDAETPVMTDVVGNERNREGERSILPSENRNPSQSELDRTKADNDITPSTS